MVQCCVPFCKSTPGPSNNYSFHEFPVTKVRFEWLRRIARKANGTGNKPWCPSDRSKVCSLHFREEDFRRDLKKRRLLPNAVPSIFPGYPPEMQQARRLSSPQMGDAPKVLETNSAIDKRIARPRRGRKRKCCGLRKHTTDSCATKAGSGVWDTFEEQLRCLGQTKHRWREETLQCCLLWNTLSPRGYRLISQSGLLSLPSCSTLKRHIGAVGNSTASNREPPSPTGDTLPSMEDIDDIHQLPDIVDVHVMEPSTDEVSDYASEVSVHSDTDDTARVDVSSETTVQDGSVANASPDLQAERSQCSTKDAASIVCPESGRKLKSVRDSQTRKKSLTRHFARVLAGNPTPQEGEQVLQVVYTKPSDILDDLPGVDSATPGAGDTTAAPESADELVEKSVVHKAKGRVGYRFQ
ncbi:hypothetical protein HPB52_008012 [Rhipicephalus sanguineus]|uniref:THAP-type domain-containing protein n=1 Tax=Rhipicephalus sanguineus TaxID=34632 RepID=A0A9D4SU67_RHISA|nr:hypothetical protein HPB52_008012 [Rhipicephalus sanguineus]